MVRAVVDSIEKDSGLRQFFRQVPVHVLQIVFGKVSTRNTRLVCHHYQSKTHLLEGFQSLTHTVIELKFLRARGVVTRMHQRSITVDKDS
jgi:hypothetical protein